MQVDLAVGFLLIAFFFHLVWDWLKHRRIEERLRDLESVPVPKSNEESAVPEPTQQVVVRREEKPARQVLYIGTAGLGEEALRGSQLTVEWNRRWFDGDVVVIGDDHPMMKSLYEAAAPKESTRWFVGTMSLYVAMKAFLQSDYESMYYAKWDLLRDPRQPLDSRRGLCCCSLSVDNYRPTEWEKTKEKTCTSLLRGQKCFEWDQVMATFFSLSRVMVMDVIEVLDRGKINPMDSRFWARAETVCEGRFYADMLLECYMMLSQSWAIGNVFDRIGLVRHGVAQGKPWVHFDGMALSSMREWMTKVEKEVS